MRVARTWRRVRLRLSNLSLAAVIAVGVACAGAWAMGPVLPVLLAERSLAAQIEALRDEPRLGQMTDTEIRSQIQQRARASGFHIEFEDIFIEYKTPQRVGMPLPAKLGYTLHLELPLFGFVNWPLVALRIYPVGEQRTDER